jgi:hypothetical protein
MSNYIKICPVGAELFHADVKTDMRKLRVAFRKGNAPKTVFSNRSHSEIAETYSSTSTIFYLTTRIATSITLLRVMAGIAIPVYRESGSTPFTAAYCS